MTDSLHHPAEDITSDRDLCWRCEHDQAAHGSYSSTTSPCFASDEISVINGVPTATPCTCKHFTRGYWRLAGITVAVLAGVWVLLSVVAMVR